MLEENIPLALVAAVIGTFLLLKCCESEDKTPRTMLKPVEVKGWCGKVKQSNYLDYEGNVISILEATKVTTLNRQLKDGYHDQKFYDDV